MTKLFPVKMGRPTNKPSIEKLSELYESHTSKEIAEMYGVKVGTVHHWVYKYRKQLAAEAAEQETAQEET